MLALSISRQARALTVHLGLVLSFGCTVGAAAHEFWLEPTDFTPKVQQTVPISIRIGQEFKGDSFPYIRAEFKRFVVVNARGESPVKGVDGDDPAVHIKFAAPGLHVVSHYSTREPVAFDTWDEFTRYLAFEGLEWIAPLHLQQGKPAVGIKETYTRCAKLLMAVGAVQGDDRPTGMPLELVALRNPYALHQGEPFAVRLLHEGRPISGVQISAIGKADPKNRLLARTDADGRASFELPARGPWLLNAVHMVEPPRGSGFHWASLWASMTFARP